MKLIKTTFKILPYLASILVGFIFLYIGLKLESDIKSLLINISSAFFAIPLVFLGYQLVSNLSHKKLNKEIFDYAKMKIDTDILTIVKQLQKIVFPYQKRDSSLNGISNFLHLKKDEIEKIISQNEYLGFQVLKKWEISTINLSNALQNPFMHRSLNEEHLISVVSIIKGISSFEVLQSFTGTFVPNNRTINSYRIVRGTKINEENEQFPDRYLLLKYLSEDKFIVEDFGDFAPYDYDRLLQVFTIKEEIVDTYSLMIYNLINEANNWLTLTGKEVIYDPKLFKFRQKQPIKQT